MGLKEFLNKYRQICVKYGVIPEDIYSGYLKIKKCSFKMASDEDLIATLIGLTTKHKEI